MCAAKLCVWKTGRPAGVVFLKTAGQFYYIELVTGKLNVLSGERRLMKGWKTRCRN